MKSYLEDRCASAQIAHFDLFARQSVPLPVASLRRILKYAGCSEETFILALIYMDQVVQFNPEFVISSLNVHRLLITSIMVRRAAAAERALASAALYSSLDVAKSSRPRQADYHTGS